MGDPPWKVSGNVSFHDETPTTELPVVQAPDEPTPRGAGALIRKFVKSRRIGVVALASVVTLGVAGIALGAAGASDNHISASSVRQSTGLPTQIPPNLTPPRDSRG